MTDETTEDDREGPPRSRAAPLDIWRSLPDHVPGMASNAPKRNALVVFGILLGSLLLIGVVTTAL